jgi:hypothetical protein
MISRHISDEAFRQCIAAVIVVVYIVLVVTNFFCLTMHGSDWLLLSNGIWLYPFHKVVGYYFRRI